MAGKKGDSKLVTIGTFWNPSYLSTEDNPQFTTKSQSFRTKNKALSYTANAPEQIFQGIAKQTTASINKTSMGWFGIYSKDMDTISQNKAANTYENNLKDAKEQINFQLFTSAKPAQDDNRYAVIKTVKDKKLTLYLEGFGGYDSSIGKTVKCRTTVFIDNQPVKTTAGDDYIETTMSNDKLSVQSFSLDLSGLSSGKHALYAVSVPISGYQYVSDQMGYSQNSMATKTETHLLVIE